MGSPRIDRLERNYIINGSFDFWQRGIADTTVSSTTRLADRFSAYREAVGGGTVVINRQTDSPNSLTEYSKRLRITSAMSAVVAGDLVGFDHHIEGINYRSFYQKPIAISFWVKASGTGVTGRYYGSLRNNAGDFRYLFPFDVTVAGVWQRVTALIPATLGGSWLLDNQRGISLFIAVRAGSTYHGTVNQWISTSGAIAGADINTTFGTTLNNEFLLAQVMLTEGSVVPENFIRAGYEVSSELQLCQRYFRRLGSGMVGNLSNGSTRAVVSAFFDLPMRAVPNVSFASGVSAIVYAGESTQTFTPTFQGSQQTTTGIYVYVGGTTATGGFVDQRVAQLQSDFINVDAEL